MAGLEREESGARRCLQVPLASEYGTYNTVKARFWPCLSDYRGTSLMRNSVPLGPYSRNIPGALW